MNKYFSFITLLIGSFISQADDLISIPILNTFSPTQNSIRGQLKASEFTVISAGLSGKLTGFPVTHGQRVTKGQTLVVFNCKMETAEKAVAVAKLNAARSKLKANTELIKYKNISHLEVTLSKAEVAIQRAELKRAQAVLSECSIKAPFSGVVTEKTAQAHQYIKEGDPLLELVNTSNLEVEMVIPSLWLTRLPVGAEFSIQFDEFPVPVKAKITRTGGVIDPVSQTIRVIGELIESPSQLLPGMSGEISFYKEDKNNGNVVNGVN